MNIKKGILGFIYIVLLLLCIRYILTELETLTPQTILSEHLLHILAISSLYIVWLFFEVSSLYVLTNREVAWLTLFKIYLIGEAYNCLTPFMGYGGDPVRAHYLQKEIGISQASHSIILFKYIDIVAAVTIGLIAQVIAFYSIENLPELWNRIMLASIFLFSCIMVVFLVGLYKNTTNALSKYVLKIFKIDFEQYDISTQQKTRAYLLQCCSRIFILVEISLVAMLLSYHLSLQEAIFILSFCSLSTVYFFFIPNGIGSNEVMLSQSTVLLGYGSELGLFIALARRIRSISWAILGLLLHLIIVLLARSIRRA